MNERVFGPHDPDWTKEHQEASEPTARELLLIRQRDEARAVAETACSKYNALLEENRKVTCVYCGKDYPEGTPTSQDAALYAHIEACSKHPLHQARKELAAVQAAAAEAEQCLEIQWRAAQRARERWAEAHPEDKAWPDRADLLAWLMEELERAGKDEATWYAKGHNAGRKATGMSLENTALREALRKLWYLRVPTGMKLEEMLLELGHKELWQEIYPLVEPEKT